MTTVSSSRPGPRTVRRGSGGLRPLPCKAAPPVSTARSSSERVPALATLGTLDGKGTRRRRRTRRAGGRSRSKVEAPASRPQCERTACQEQAGYDRAQEQGLAQGVADPRFVLAERANDHQDPARVADLPV